jgi:hypothetical protein
VYPGAAPAVTPEAAEAPTTDEDKPE